MSAIFGSILRYKVGTFTYKITSYLRIKSCNIYI